MYTYIVNILKNNNRQEISELFDSLLSKATNQGLNEAEIVFMETCKKLLNNHNIVNMESTITGVSDVGL